MRRLTRPALAAALAAVLLLAASPSSGVPNWTTYTVYDCDLDLYEARYICPDGVTVVIQKERARVFGDLEKNSGVPVERLTVWTGVLPDVADLGPMRCRITVRPDSTASGRCQGRVEPS